MQKLRLSCVTIYNKNELQCYNLFAVVEYLQPWMQDFNKPDVNLRCPQKMNGQWRCYFHSQVIDSFDETDIAKSLSAINVRINVKNDGGYNESNILLNGYTLLPEPANYTGGVYVNPKETPDFSLAQAMPERQSGYYVKSYIDRKQTMVEFVDKHNLKRWLRLITEKNLGYDLNEYSEHLGNVYVIHNNPLFRSVEIAGSFDTKKGLYLYFEQMQQNTFKLKVRVVVKHHHRHIVSDTMADLVVTSRLEFLPYPIEPHCTDITIYDSQTNVILYHTSNICFIRNISLRSSISEPVKGTLIVCGEEKEYVKYRPAANESSTRETALLPNLEEWFNVKRKKEYDRLSLQNHLFCFDGGPDSKQEVHQVLTGIIAKTHGEIMFFDPYFDAKNFEEYINGIESLDTHICIMNCNGLVDINGKKDLLRHVERYEQQFGVSIDCRVCRGDRLHDRYILSKDAVWMMGASFSEMGRRATSIVKLPKDEEIKARSMLNMLWTDATPLKIVITNAVNNKKSCELLQFLLKNLAKFLSNLRKKICKG